MSPITRAAEALGGVPKLAEELGISRQAIYQWRAIPLEHVAKIERLTKIPLRELRPDVFGEAA